MQGKRTKGWRLVGWVAMLVALAGVFVLAEAGSGEEGLRLGVRVTARLAFVLFLATFVARPLHAIAPSLTSRWLLANRRFIGVSFAVAMGGHAMFIIAVARAFSESFWARLGTATLVGGLVGYAFIAAMTATSFDRSRKWLGRRAWARLHTAGIWFLWVVFAFSYAPSACVRPLGGVFTLLLVSSLGVRMTALIAESASRRRSFR